MFRKFKLIFVFNAGEHWLGNCSTCVCLRSKDAETGFNKISCERKKCAAFDEKACIEADGAIVKTDDGCCFTCDNVCVYNNETYKVIGFFNHFTSNKIKLF